MSQFDSFIVLDSNDESKSDGKRPLSQLTRNYIDSKRRKITLSHSPTEQQKKVIDCDGSLIFIQAFAGSGKTTTLQYYCAKRTDKRFLYLAFNRSAKKLADERFGFNVTCKTIDALCYEIAASTSKSMRNLNCALIKEVCPELGSKNSFCWALLEWLKMFLSSTRHMDVKEYGEANCIDDEIIDYMDIFWSMASKSSCEWTTHEINRKLALGKDAESFIREYLDTQYDIILVDECQDLSNITLSILNRFSKQKIFVGDMHQAIYSFLGNINAFERLAPSHRFQLTKSFRFGDAIAKRARWVICELKGFAVDDSNALVEGNALDTILVDIIPSTVKYTILARLNKTLFYEAKKLIQSDGKKIYWHAKDDFFSRLTQMLSLRGDRAKWKARKIKAMDEHDKETITAMELIEECGEKELVRLMDDVGSHLTVESVADVILSTVHKAKGLEWDNVRVHGDIALGIMDAFSAKKWGGDYLKRFDEECNIYYVAITRARKILCDNVYGNVSHLVR
jgi:hypothetical protein